MDVENIFDAFGGIFDDLLAPESSPVGRVAASYGTSPTKRSGRRSKAEIMAIRAEIMAVVSRLRPKTVRQVFYQLVTRGVIPKSEGERETLTMVVENTVRTSGKSSSKLRSTKE